MKEIVYLLFDISGSIDSLKERYKDVYDYYKSICDEVIIVSFNTFAKYSTIDEILNSKFFGGTYISSGIELVAGRALATNNNVTIVICSDGDNWSEDNIRVYNLIYKLNKNNVNFICHEFIVNNIYCKSLDNILKQLDFNIKRYKITNDNQDIFGEEKQIYLLYLVEHKVNGIPYTFRSEKIFDIDEIVVCNTKYGKTYGKIIGTKFEKLTNQQYINYKTINKLI